MSDPQSSKQQTIYVGGQRIDISEGQINISGDIPQRRGRRRGCGCGLLAALIGIVLIGAFIWYIAVPFFETGGGNADTRPVPGDANQFDPVGALPGVTDYAGAGAKLLAIKAYYVRSDGTMDLTASYSPSPRVSYEFVRELAEAPADAPPIGAGGANTGPWYEPITIEAYQPGQWRSVSRIGGGVSLKYSYMNKGMERKTSKSTSSAQRIAASPECAFADLWKVAITKDAPKSAVAIIQYDANGYGFSISGLSVNLQFGMDCKLKR